MKEEGISGAAAVALATNFVASGKKIFEPAAFFDFIKLNLPDIEGKTKVRKAASLSPNSDIRTATAISGNGITLTAQDTVPFALWCAAHNHHNFEGALLRAISGLGDRDTICAIVGSIVILSASKDTIPQTWIGHTEGLQDSIFLNVMPLTVHLQKHGFRTIPKLYTFIEQQKVSGAEARKCHAFVNAFC